MSLLVLGVVVVVLQPTTNAFHKHSPIRLLLLQILFTPRPFFSLRKRLPPSPASPSSSGRGRFQPMLSHILGDAAAIMVMVVVEEEDKGRHLSLYLQHPIL